MQLSAALNLAMCLLLTTPARSWPHCCVDPAKRQLLAHASLVHWRLHLAPRALTSMQPPYPMNTHVPRVYFVGTGALHAWA
eukprot:2768351-Amphidinium_carterae.1